MGDAETRIVRTVASILDIDAAAWDACANPVADRFNPFVSHAFLAALEKAGTLGERAGWISRHLTLEDSSGAIAAVLPLYVKLHSQGEYVFDHGWADAYHRAGGQYYPKLVAAVPFTPVPGPRILVKPGEGAEERQKIMALAAIEMTRALDASSLHINFLPEADGQRLAALGFLNRTGQQFHWHNAGYATFDDFLASLASRKRKAIRKERQEAIAGGVEIERLTGKDITEDHWDAMYAFYIDTGSRKWGRPYLNRRFFSLLGEALAERCLLILARRHGRAIAGALNLIGGDCLYGRYWGSIEPQPFLHFEICYYQAIDYAICNRIARVEAGAQGEHKLARGYLPCATHSAHWIADPGLLRAVAQYLQQERAAVAEEIEILTSYGPFRQVVRDEAE